MPDADPYIALMTSLPSSERLFVAQKPPLTRLRLERRLRQLAPEDRRTVARMEDVLSWSAYGMDDTAAMAVTRVRSALAEIHQPTLRSIIQERLDLRTGVAALRRRRDGAASAPPAPWGYSRWARTIAANWADPTFKLERALPWLGQAKTLVEAQDPLALERFLLDLSFRQLQRHAAQHAFDVEAVVIYVLKWNIFDRWAQADAAAAAKRFAVLADAALADFPDLIRDGEAA